MNARSTVSGTTSVLIEPCRKKSRSCCDHVGTCAFADGVPFDEFRATLLCRSRARCQKNQQHERHQNPEDIFGFHFRRNLKKSDKICKARAIMCEIERVNRFVLYAGK